MSFSSLPISHDNCGILSRCISFVQVKQGLGGKVRIILSGAAPLAPHVEAYLKVVTGSHVLQGYGTPSFSLNLIYFHKYMFYL